MYRFAQAFAVLGVSMWLISWLSDFFKAKRRSREVLPSESNRTGFHS